MNDKFLGYKLKKDIFNKSGLLLAASSSVLDDEQLRDLEKHEVRLEPSDVQLPVSSRLLSINEQGALIEESVSQIKEMFQEMRQSRSVPLVDIHRHIVPMIQQTTEHPNLFELFSSIQSKDDYTFRHNIGVGVMATLIGRWLGLDDRELNELTVAATLHDVGKVKIPLEILNKPGKLTTDEFQLIKKHTIFGYKMLKDTSGTNHRQALVALQHHERQDGSGYPFAVGSDQIDPLSRIVAVADVFHAMTSKRSYKDASPLYQTLSQMHQNAFGEFDARITHLFLEKIMQALIGNQIKLTDGRTGTMIMIHHQDPLRPLIRLADDSFLDLSKESAVQIDQVIA